MSRRDRRRGGAARAAIGFVHPGEWKACFAESLLELVLTDLSPMGEQRTAHQDGTISVGAGAGGIASARNEIADKLLDSSADWLLMVDSDAGFHADVLERLIAAADPVDRPVVGGLAFGAKKERPAPIRGVRYRAYPTLMQFYETDEKVGFSPLREWPENELVQVGGTGCHCLLIHRNALEKIRERFAARFAVGEQWFSPINHPKGPTTFSEDLSFCLRLAAADLPLYVHTGVKTTHDKGFAFLDEEFYVNQEIAAGRLVPREEAECPQPVRS